MHSLGVIIYLNQKGLRDTIISDPKWLNNIFKFILDFGRKKIENVLEYISNSVGESNVNYFTLKEYLSYLKGNTNKNLSLEEIWDQNDKKLNSNVDKISFESLLNKLEEIENNLKEEKQEIVVILINFFFYLKILIIFN